MPPVFYNEVVLALKRDKEGMLSFSGTSFSFGNEVLHFKIPFHMPRSTYWICILKPCVKNRERLEDCGLSHWKTQWRCQHGLGVILFGNIQRLGGVWMEPLIFRYKWYKTEDEFRKWSKQRKENEKAKTQAARFRQHEEIILQLFYQYLLKWPHVLYLLHQRMIFSTV